MRSYYRATFALILVACMVAVARADGPANRVETKFGGQVDGTNATTGQTLVKQADGSWRPGTPSSFAGGAVTTPITFPDGTVSAPSITFTADTQTGLFRLGSGVVAAVSSGTQVFQWGPSGIDVQGTLSASDGLGASIAISGGNALITGGVGALSDGLGGQVVVSGGAVSLEAANGHTVGVSIAGSNAFNFAKDGSNRHAITWVGHNSGSFSIAAPVDVTGAYVWPSAIASGAGKVLTDAAGDGVLSWTTPISLPYTATDTTTVNDTVFTINKSPGSADSGHAFALTGNSHTTGTIGEIDNAGSGDGLDVTMSGGPGGGVGFGVVMSGTTDGQGIVVVQAGSAAGTCLELAPRSATTAPSFKVRYGDVLLNSSGSTIAQNATHGFLYVPRCATGAPSGTPTPYTGAGAMVIGGDHHLWAELTTGTLSQIDGAGGSSTYPLTITAQTSDTTLAANTFSANTGASTDVQLTLPAAPATGSVEQAFVTANHYVKIKAPASSVIYAGVTSSATAGYWRSTSIGSTIFLVYVGSNTWLATITGNWTVDS